MAEWYEQLLELHLGKNQEIWAQLCEDGVDDDSLLRLGFLYLAPGAAEAQLLVDFLRAETDYEVDARLQPGKQELSWVVIGTTQPTPVSLALLDDWTNWMIAAGAAEGPCAFDSWAAQLVADDDD
ncbi:MAG TPA: hypothetical protein VHZ75_04975 [Solirubrobacteraceae bacterium]|jgi:hypothetical protein|nr:hypothetical protein [Solirubrobacteraceae bacterium]